MRNLIGKGSLILPDTAELMIVCRDVEQATYPCLFFNGTETSGVGEVVPHSQMVYVSALEASIDAIVPSADA